MTKEMQELIDRDLDAAQELAEDHPMFAAWFSAAKTALGVDDATAEELLAKCVKDGY